MGRVVTATVRTFFLALLLLASASDANAKTSRSVETWATTTSVRQRDGWAIVARYAHTLRKEFKKSDQPHRIVIVWKYDGPNGMPSTDLSNRMVAMEDA